MKVLVIIVSYNFEPWIERCLGSLRLSRYPVDTVVIDNGSKDRTIQRIKKDFPEVRLLPQTENLGFGKANNIGMKIALKEGYDFAGWKLNGKVVDEIPEGTTGDITLEATWNQIAKKKGCSKCSTNLILAISLFASAVLLLKKKEH